MSSDQCPQELIDAHDLVLIAESMEELIAESTEQLIAESTEQLIAESTEQLIAESMEELIEESMEELIEKIKKWKEGMETNTKTNIMVTVTLGQ